jgi:hypothetical protein
LTPSLGIGKADRLGGLVTVLFWIIHVVALQCLVLVSHDFLCKSNFFPS